MTGASRPCFRLLLLALALLSASGCATYHRSGLSPQKARLLEAKRFGLPKLPLNVEDKILALDPLAVSERDIRDVLSRAPAPRIVNIHGGIYPVHRKMISFSQFLIGMGYPAASIVNAVDGTYTFSCYEDSSMIAGMIAWYYEKEGLRPMIVGHSQGGFQAVKILQKYASDDPEGLAVWNPLTWKREYRYQINDPLTGKKRPVAGLTLPYVTAMGAGGVTRMLPNQWDMAFTLRSVPDTVEEFTGFYKGRDLLGGDMWGYGSMNFFHAAGTAKVRNIELPAPWKHGAVPDTKHLLKSKAIIDRINDYRPPPDPELHIPADEENLKRETLHLAWAEDVWYSIKKHWVLELQRFIKAKRARTKK
jgi:pimeloyl-ACP methyl ester carboxylesterase